MRTIKIMSFAVLGALALSPAAFAQDAGAAPADTASGKRFAVVGGVTLLQPKSGPATGIDKVDGGPAPTLSASVRRRPTRSMPSTYATGNHTHTSVTATPATTLIPHRPAAAPPRRRRRRG